MHSGWSNDSFLHHGWLVELHFKYMYMIAMDAFKVFQDRLLQGPLFWQFSSCYNYRSIVMLLPDNNLPTDTITTHFYKSISINQKNNQSINQSNGAEASCDEYSAVTFIHLSFRWSQSAQKDAHTGHWHNNLKLNLHTRNRRLNKVDHVTRSPLARIESNQILQYIFLNLKIITFNTD